ncbi:MAG: hypothetical protein NVS9B2_07980 [Steroidobacteraceae bacterium]
MNSSRDKELQPPSPGKVQPATPAGLVSVDEQIDGIAQKALDTARRAQELEKRKRKSHPPVPPK